MHAYQGLGTVPLQLITGSLRVDSIRLSFYKEPASRIDGAIFFVDIQVVSLR